MNCVCLWAGGGCPGWTHTPPGYIPPGTPTWTYTPRTHHLLPRDSYTSETHTPFPGHPPTPHNQQASSMDPTGMLSCLIIFFWNTSVLFEGPLIPFLWTCGDICTGVKAREDALVGMLCCLHAIDSSDSPLMWHLLTSWQPAWQASHYQSTYLHTYKCCLGSRLPLPYSVWQDRRFTEWAMAARLDFSKVHKVCVSLSQVVKHLVEQGCKINCQDSTGNTVLHYCCLNGNNAAANLLLEVRKYGGFTENSALLTLWRTMVLW